MHAMRKRYSVSATILTALITVAALTAAGCTADTSDLETLTVGELASMLEKNADLAVYDANGQQVREEYGVIPGARLLSSGSSYDVAAELPADKNSALVFYCSSEMCSAAPKAAHRAREAGYQDVAVLPEGIKGWVKAGKPVNTVPVS